MVFWNLAAELHGADNCYPVKVDESGVCAVSGFSPAILRSVLRTGGRMTPRQIMLDTIDVPRYRVFEKEAEQAAGGANA